MRIEVTQKDIDDGVGGAPSPCPVARAVQRATGQNWTVGCKFARLYGDGGLAVRVPIPDEIAERILTFDLQGEMRPFAFDLPFEGAVQR